VNEFAFLLIFSRSKTPNIPTEMESSTVRSRSGQGSKTDATVEEAPTPPQPEHTLEEYERLFGVDEDAYEQPTTTRKELWSYYLYYNGKAPKLGDFPPRLIFCWY
jgi:hypothetical protein